MISRNIDIPLDEIEALCRRYPVRRLSLFGSVLRDDFRPDSDIDVLVEFEPDARLTLLDLSRMEREFSEMLGRYVELREPEELSHYFRQQVLDTALVIYERA